MLTSPDHLVWLRPPRATADVCVVCGNGAGNEVFLQVGPAGQSIAVGHDVDVARCGRCSSAWFPSLVVDDSYTPGDESALTDVVWSWIDQYVELAGGLDWKIGLSERLAHDDVRRVLEVGCNTGLFLDYVQRVWGAEVVGLEPSLYGLAGARRLGLPIRPAYMHELIDEAPEPFDLVLCTDVIEHVADPLLFLTEIRALVRPGGRVFLTTPNAEGLTEQRPAGDLYGMLSVGSHRMVLSAEALRSLAHQAGFASAHVQADPAALVAVLADEPVELRPFREPDERLLRYHDARLAAAPPGPHPPRWRLADLIARYVTARQLGVADALEGEDEIDATLHREFSVDIADLSSLVSRVGQVATIQEFIRLAPLSLPAYLYFRGHRDDLSEWTRTELWETAVLLIARGIRIDPVNLALLERTLDQTIIALAGRTSGRWNDAARAALAAVPALSDRDLPHVKSRRWKQVGRRVRRLVDQRSADA